MEKNRAATINVPLAEINTVLTYARRVSCTCPCAREIAMPPYR